MYKITSLNSDENTVAVEFEHNDHKLNHTTIVDDITNKDCIVEAVEKDFDAFKNEIESLPEKVTLPAEVEALVGATVETEE